MAIMEFLRHRQHPESAEFDPYEDVFGKRLSVEALLSIREMEDVWIDLGHMAEEEREPVPGYLNDEWLRTVGPGEINRPNGVEG